MDDAKIVHGLAEWKIFVQKCRKSKETPKLKLECTDLCGSGIRIHLWGWSESEAADVHVVLSMKTEIIASLGEWEVPMNHATNLEEVDSVAHLFDAIE